MAQQLVARTPMDDVRALGAPGDRSYEFVFRKLREALSERHANLFAEPVTSQSGASADWMTPILGPVRAADDLSETEYEALLAELRTLTGDIEALIAELRASGDHGKLRQAQALGYALEIPDLNCLHQVGDQPVLVLWAHSHDRHGAPTRVLRKALGKAAEPAAPPPEPQFTKQHAPIARFSPGHDGMIVGRSAGSGKVVIDHPAISQRHAMYRVEDGSLVVRDLGSATGTFVNGVRVTGPTKVGAEDRVDIGPFRFNFDGEVVEAEDQTAGASLMLRDVTREVVIANRKEPLRILDRVSLDIAPGEFVCIIGPSGSGKSTLMNAMSARVRPTSGNVYFGGLDLHRHFDLLKQSIAMVPQHNLLHETLTLRRALGYTAKLRLPSDMSSAERARAIESAVTEVGLEQRIDTRIGLLSGGQKKRCSLANEILSRPGLLFLDEVTSGLDESTDLEIMTLLRSMADQGMTIVCVTHTLANVEAHCDRLVVMNVGGVLAYAGPPSGALGFFGVPRLGEIFNRLPDRPAADWHAAYQQNAPALGVVDDGRDQASSGKSRRGGGIGLFRTLRQTGIVAHRNVALLLGDIRIWLMALLQSALIGALVGYAFTDLGPDSAQTQSKISLLLLLGLSGLWIGCNSASKDVVGERLIFERENDVNLSATAFVTSKFLVTGVFTVVQMSIVFLLTWLIAQDLPGDPALQFGFSALAGIAGCCLGLFISSISTTTEQATTIVPLVLVPQLILCGIIVPHLPELAANISEVAMTSNVLVESMTSVFLETDGPIYTLDADTGQRVEMSARPYLSGLRIILAHCAMALLLSLQITAWRQVRRRRSV